MRVRDLVDLFAACDPNATVVMSIHGNDEALLVDEVQPCRFRKARGMPSGDYSGDAEPSRRNAVCLLPVDIDPEAN